MQSKYWRWFLYAFLICYFVEIAIHAFSVPWQWNVDQCCFAFVTACIPLGIVKWGRIWKREGWAGIKERWAATEKARSETEPGRFGIQIAVWIVIALALVLFFNLTEG